MRNVFHTVSDDKMLQLDEVYLSPTQSMANV